MSAESNGRAQRGQLGERLAIEHLVRRGYRVVETNWRTRFGEIDIVAMDGRTLVFVEVRTRASSALGTAAESVGPRKRRQLVHMAEQYLQRLGPGAVARIDVVTVRLDDGAKPRLEHIVGAVDA